jgi:hypothetical protein
MTCELFLPHLARSRRRTFEVADQVVDALLKLRERRQLGDHVTDRVLRRVEHARRPRRRSSRRPTIAR